MRPAGKALGIIAIATLVASCSLARQGQKQAVVKGCVLPQDQTGTMSGKWRLTPIPVAFHQASNFSALEVSQIAAAVNTWNTFMGESLQLQPLDIGSGGSFNGSTAPHPTNPCQPIIQGNSFTGAIVIYKMGAWPASYSPSAIALTTTCPTPAQPFPQFYGGIMELNYQNFFVAGKKLPDLQTIVLHELGHVLGLNHSCEVSAGTGVPGCSDFGINISYAQAVMAPTFSFDSSGIGEQKRTLTANDQGRANCLYEPTPAPRP